MFTPSSCEHSLGQKDKWHFWEISKSLDRKTLEKPYHMMQTWWEKGRSYFWIEMVAMAFLRLIWNWTKVYFLLFICYNWSCRIWSLRLKGLKRYAFQLFISLFALKIVTEKVTVTALFWGLPVIGSIPLNTSAFNLEKKLAKTKGDTFNSCQSSMSCKIIYTLMNTGNTMASLTSS